MSSVKNLDVQCQEDGMGVTIEFDSPFKGVIFSKGHYNDPNCVYVQNAHQNKVTFVIRADRCGTVVGARGGNVIESNAISNRVKRQAEDTRAVPDAGANIKQELPLETTDAENPLSIPQPPVDGMQVFPPNALPGIGEHGNALNGVQSYDDSQFYNGEPSPFGQMDQMGGQFGQSGFQDPFASGGQFAPGSIQKESMGGLDFGPPVESQRAMPQFYDNQLQGRNQFPGQFSAQQQQPFGGFGGGYDNFQPPMEAGFQQPNMTGGMPFYGGMPQQQQQQNLSAGAAPGMFADPFGANMANYGMGDVNQGMPFNVFNPSPANVMEQSQIPGQSLHHGQIGNVQNFDDARFYNFEDNEPNNLVKPQQPQPTIASDQPLRNIDTDSYVSNNLNARVSQGVGLGNAVDPIFQHFSSQSENPNLDLSGAPPGMLAGAMAPNANTVVRPPSSVPAGPAQDPFMSEHFKNLAQANQGFNPNQDALAKGVLNINPADLASGADSFNQKVIDGVSQGSKNAGFGAPQPDHIFKISQPPHGTIGPNPAMAAPMQPPSFLGNVLDDAREKSAQAPNPMPKWSGLNEKANNFDFNFGAAPNYDYEQNPSFNFEGKISAFPNFGGNLETEQGRLENSPSGGLPSLEPTDSFVSDGASAFPNFPGIGSGPTLGDAFSMPTETGQGGFGAPPQPPSFGGQDFMGGNAGPDFNMAREPQQPDFGLGGGLSAPARPRERQQPQQASQTPGFGGFGFGQPASRQNNNRQRAPIRNSNPPEAEYIENIIIIQNDPDVQEVWDTARAIRCEWRTNYRKVVSTKQRAAMTEVQTMRFAGDDVEVWMEIQSGKGPWADPVANIVPIGHTMTLLIGANDKKSEFDLRVGKCRAHDGVRSPIFLTDRDGCVMKSKLMSPFMKANNWGPHSSTIAFAHFSAFKFPETTNVYIECDVEVCKHGCRDMCPSAKPQIVDASDLANPTEASREKRETETYGKVKGRFQAITGNELSFNLADISAERLVNEENLALEEELRSSFCISRQGLALGLGLTLSALVCSLLVALFLFIRYKNQSPSAERRRKMAMLEN